MLIFIERGDIVYKVVVTKNGIDIINGTFKIIHMNN